jgi:nitroreductase
MSEVSTYRTGLPSYALRFVAEVAGRAPSVHNTQPWLIRATSEGAVELLADRSRQLLHADPHGRELHVSCGAALFGLRLGIGLLGYRPDVTLLPADSEPDVLARLRRGGATDVSRSDRALLSALSRRHTHRGAFTHEPVSAELLGRLQDVVAKEGASLTVVTGDQRAALAELVQHAERRQQLDPAHRAELRTWTPGREGRSDGVPATTYAAVVPRPGRGELAQRDFGLARPGHGHRPAPHVVGATSAVVLSTPDDDRSSWLAAGAALHHALLVAADSWVFAGIHTQPLQLPDVREEVSELLGGGHVQMLLTLGHAHVAPTTPRRATHDVLVSEPAD